MQGRACNIGGANEVDLDDPAEHVRRNVLELSVRHDRRGVHHDVDMSEPRNGGFDESRDRFLVCNVDGHYQGLCTGALGRYLGEAVLAARGEHELGSSLRECVSGGATDAAGRTNDDSDGHGARTTLMQPSSFFWKIS